MKRIVFLFILFFAYLSSDAQIIYRSADYLYKNRVSVGAQAEAATPSSVWFRIGDSASNYGFLNPTAAQRDSVRSKGNMYRGTQVFDLFEEKPYWWNGTEWITWTTSEGDTAYLVNLSPTLGDTLLFPVSSTEIGIKSFRVSSGKGLLAAYVTDSTFGVDIDTSGIVATRFWVDSLFGTIGGGVGTVTNVATGWGLYGGPITTTGTITPDTTLLTSRLRLYKVADSLQLINSASNGLTETSNVIQLGGALIQNTTITPSTFQFNVRTDNLGVTQTDVSGVNLLNNTDASAGAQQVSPALRFHSEGWKTNATAASQEIDIQVYSLPVQAAANPQPQLKFLYNTNAGGYTDWFDVTATGLRHRGFGGAGAGISLNSLPPVKDVFYATNGLLIQNGAAATAGTFGFVNTTGYQQTSGSTYVLSLSNGTTLTGFYPSSGTATHSVLDVNGYIDQTGGASGITRGVHISTTIENAADWRALEIDYGSIYLNNTITTAGTTGAVTINKASGTCNFAAGATSLVVTNSWVTASSIVYAVVRTADGSATGIKSVVPAAGSFTITLNTAPAGEISVGFIVFNK